METETEFKFHIPSERLKAVESALRGAAAVRTHLQARYFDTEDGALAAHGVVLRLRQEGRRWVQTAKAAGDGPLQRLEHNVDLGVARASAPPVLDALRHAGTPVGERLAHALAAAPAAPLVETYGTDIWRLTRQVRAGGATVELALDLGRIVAPPRGGGPARVAPVCELELELIEGDVRGLVALAHECAQQHGLWFSTVSKAERGARLRAGLERVPAVKATAPRFAGHGRPRPTGRALQRAVVAACLAQILPNASEVAADSEDTEQIHQLRVGLRRLRTALRELNGLAPGFDPAWQAPLAAAFRTLGARRDRELLLRHLQPQLRQAGAPPYEPPGDDAAAASPGEAVRAPDFQSVLVALIGFTAQAAPVVHGAGRPAEADRHETARPVAACLAASAARSMAMPGTRWASTDTPPGDEPVVLQGNFLDEADAEVDADADTDPDGGSGSPPAVPAEVILPVVDTALHHDSGGEHATQDSSPGEARRRLRARLERLHARTVRDGKRFDTLSFEARHGVRKRLKRLRYLAEFAAPLFDAHGARRYLAQLEPAQDALGVANDEAVALGVYRAAAASDPRAWFAVGWLGAREADHVRASRKALRHIAEAPHFWKKSG